MREIASKTSIMTGNEAVAEGVRLSKVGFISAYPITGKSNNVVITVAPYIQCFPQAAY